MRIPSGVTDQYIYFVAVDATDLKSRETGLSSFTVYRSRNGAAAAAMTTPTINETDGTNMPGVYELLLDEDMTIGSGNDSEEMAFHITASGMAPVTRVIELYRPKVTAGYTLGVGSDGDLLEVNTLTSHTAQTGDSYARIGAAGASLTDLGGMSTGMKAEVNAEADTALSDYDPPTKAELDSGLAGLNDITVASILTTQMTESYAADGAAPTLAQALMLIQQQIGEFAISGTTLTVKKVDGSTTAATFTLDDGASPTSITRAT